MPRFARIFEAAADTLTAYYTAISECNLDALMELWISEEFASCICANGAHLYGIERIRSGFASQFDAEPVVIDALDTRVYDSLSTVVYAVAEAHRNGATDVAQMVFTTYVLVHERGEWRIAHIHATPMPDQAASQFAAKLARGQGPLH
ncbi:MAG: nuclear transport factor 2 family protein [Janthinobacterium lividum]